eukprot:355081-Chlamydomonas_euryale.AAC.4
MDLKAKPSWFMGIMSVKHGPLGQAKLVYGDHVCEAWTLSSSQAGLWGPYLVREAWTLRPSQAGLWGSYLVREAWTLRQRE